MPLSLPQRLTRSAPVILVILTLAATAAFAAVSHLVTRYNANQLSRGRKLYQSGLADADSGNAARAIDEFRAALTCDPTNSQYQLSLGRALRDTGKLDEAESYLLALVQRSPDDGAINLALGRVAARRGSAEDALRYYHNAMYGVWTKDVNADERRRTARIELIEFLLQQKANGEAESELIALATFLPSDPALHLQTAQLFSQARDYSNALAQYENVLHLDHDNAAAQAGAGDAAYRAGRYRTAQRYLQNAIKSNSQNGNAEVQLKSAELILATDPFIYRITDVERDRRIHEAFLNAGDRLTQCAQEHGIDLNLTQPRSAELAQSSAPTLADLNQRWLEMKPKLPGVRGTKETLLPDTVMDIVFQIEQQTAVTCGQPQGIDEALLLISRDRIDADR